ncbi:MAG: cob(I)yrinic acid a,c-diamide adenosyltransferase, partial [Candidatus Marsarchaeota archaeon]|nr:cob(I)yrinic acid a,c-diamide adenosyltransferase [Candidatus Marsarchaeota archaeon]
SFRASEGDRKLASEAFAKAAGFAASGKYDLVVLDEIFGAMRAGLVAEADVLGFLRGKAPNCELVLTGRGATPAIEAAADYVTHVEKVKHPSDAGITSRCGIDY